MPLVVPGVHGFVDDGYGPVADALARCGPGVTVAANVEGRRVVDLRSADLRDDALICTWSSVKPLTGACLLILVERELVGLDDPVVTVWPEIDDDRLLVRHVLTHTAGKMSLPDVPVVDWDRVVAAIAAAPSDWMPGAAIGEHAFTFGHLVGEIVRRVDGRSLGRFFADELAGPLGLDVHIGVRDDDLERVADTVGLDESWWAEAGGDPGSLRQRSLGPWVDVNDPAWRRAEIPAVNGHATARGLAAFWQAFLDGRLPPGVDRPGATGHDVFVGDEVTWTLAGGRLEGPDVGMAGLGGQWAAARPSIGLAWAFLTTHVGDHDRAELVENALIAAITRRDE